MNYVYAFFIGGALCAIAQILIDKTPLTPARILVAYVVAGVVLGGLGLYKPLIELAGCGATTPLCGFGNLLAEGVKEAVDKDGFAGILTGGLTSAAGGITASLFLGFLAACFAKSHPKG